MASELKSNVNAFCAALPELMHNRLEEAANILIDAITLTLSRPGPPASMPYDPPVKETGELERSWRKRWDGDHMQVVSDSLEALYMEIGTHTVAPRPYVNAAIAAALEDMQAVLAAEMPSTSISE